MQPGRTRLVATLVAHTNVGKTTLARTLLGRDVGEVRDAAHVTEWVDEHEWLGTADATLVLADTPGFGDSVRLERRMRLSGQPLGWLLSEVWDRWRDRAFWGSQQALRQVRERSDVVLYLVNAAEPPRLAGTLAAEMALLAWTGRPVLVLLNQLGAPRDAALERAELDAWRAALAPCAFVRQVLPLDAFARCWVQEATLLEALHEALPAPSQPAMRRVIEAWQQRSEATFTAAMQALAATLAQTLATKVPIDAGRRWRERVGQFAGAVGDSLRDSLGKPRQEADAPVSGPEERARAALLEAAEATARAGTETLLRLHGLDGRAQGEVLQRVGSLVALRRKVDEGRAALLGGMVSGALVGLKADLASGGLTLGGGALVGAVLGAAGAAGVAKGLNVVRGTERDEASWPVAAAPALAEAALLRYLAVAHFGRGRGQWQEGEAPAHWAPLVQQQVQPAAGAWRAAAERGEAAAFEPLFAAAARALLSALYPAAPPAPPVSAPSMSPRG